MYDLPRVTFLLVADTLLVAMLVIVLGGCATPPSRLRHGDFIMNVGAAPVVAPTPQATTSVAAATPQPST